MTGLLAFRDRYANEQACIAALASMHWPDSFDGYVDLDADFRFNRRDRIAELADLMLRRTVDCPSITYRQLVDGLQPQDATLASSG